MRNTKRRVGSLVLKIETNGLQILVQREIFHKDSHLQAFYWFGSYPRSMRTTVRNIDKIAIFAAQIVRTL